ncbi:MAG: amidohydrolase family protein, partial [Dehalococcoidales bacterium]|nr:amidohydrolase family protein [Dehalococcoidales bacterium]
MYVMIREGSTEKNLEELLPLVTEKSFPRFFFVTDDRHAQDILHDGDVDGVVRRAIRLGLDPIRAIQMATINPATYFRLRHVGAIAPGYLANIVVLDSLADFRVHSVYHRGLLVVREGRPLFEPSVTAAGRLKHTVNIRPFGVKHLRLRAKKDGMMPVIEVVPGQVITRKKLAQVTVRDGVVVSDPGKDILKLVVVERHRASGRIGIGLVSGFGLQKGAMASSVAHDSHNIVAVGVDDADIYAAVKEIERMQGGLVVVAGDEVLAGLA